MNTFSIDSAIDTPRWRPTPFVAGSASFTVAGLAAMAAWPGIWPWAVAGIVIDHLALTFAGLWPRCGWLGPNWTRLPAAAAARGEVAVTIDDGPEPSVTPAVLDLLDRHGVKATFFCIAERAQRHPELCREIVARGHAVENHSFRHRHNFSLLWPAAYARELAAAQDSLTALAGVRPLFFRAPAGLRNVFLDPVLSRFNLRLASWTRRGFDTRDGNPRSVLAKLLDGLAGGDILLLHDGNAALTVGGSPVILEVLPPLLDAIAAAQLKPVTLREALG